MIENHLIESVLQRLWKKLLKIKNIGTNRTNLWDTLIAFKLYTISFFLFYPLFYIIMQFGYLSTVGIIILGFSIWFIVRFVLFEQRKEKLKYFIITTLGVCIIIMNFLFSLIISVVQVNSTKFGISLIILCCSGIYFLVALKFKIFKQINIKLNKRKLEWSKKGKYLKIKVNIFKYSLIANNILLSHK